MAAGRLRRRGCDLAPSCRSGRPGRFVQHGPGLSAWTRRARRSRDRPDLARALCREGPRRCPDDTRPPSLPKRKPGRRLEMAKGRGRERRSQSDARLRHGIVQRRRRPTGPCPRLCLCQPLGRAGTGTRPEYAPADGRHHAAGTAQEGRRHGGAEGENATESGSQACPDAQAEGP